MRAAVVRAFDAPPSYSTFADPTPQAGERLVAVTAAGLHQIVKSLANGSHYGSSGELPFVPGVRPPVIGNPEHLPAYWIKISARADGCFTVTNARNGFSKTYQHRE